MAPHNRVVAGLLTAAVFFSVGCETLTYKPEAIGPEGEIIVVIDSARWNGAVGEAIRGNIAPYLGTLPAPEREFNLRQISLSSQQNLDMVRKQKNVLVVAPLTDSTTEASFLRARLDESAIGTVMNGPGAVIPRRDRCARSQPDRPTRTAG